ncbi:MAG: FecR domain-containing protein [Ignavibacteriae bacterium]|jgi:hypothetical protein|nr:hypothetical protein [Ignavibacteriota bacterium]NOG96658.1 FecR domain-containing protein [Ignavibacteriota bacterium]
MKNYIKYLKLVLGIIVLITFEAFAAPNNSPAVTVGFIMKAVQTVDYREFNNTDWEDAKIGTTLKSGDEVKTGLRSLAIIKFKDNSLLRVREKSLVTIFGDQQRKKVDKNTEIKSGTLGFDVTKQSGEEFKFTTPTMVASIKGTSGYFKVIDSKTFLFLESGIIEIESTVGVKEKVTLTAGNTATVGMDGIVLVSKASADDYSESEAVKSTKTTRVLIRTSSDEEYILEYLEK